MTPLMLLLALAAQIPQEPDDASLQSRLKQLSNVVRRIESDKTELTEVRKEKQPMAVMEQLRDLIHDKVELTPQVSEFVRSADNPKAARILALLSLVQPTDQRILLMLCSVLEETEDGDIGLAIVAGHRSAPEHWGDPASVMEWREDLVGLLPFFGCSKMYGRVRLESQFDGFRMIPDVDFSVPPKGVDYRPFFKALVAFLEKKSNSKARYQIELAVRIVKTLRIRGPDRIRFASLVRDVYLEGKDGWQAALEALADRSGCCGPNQLEILGSGLKNLDAGSKASVLGEVIRNWGHEVFRPPFSDHFEEVVAHIGTGDGTLYSTHASVFGALIRQSLDNKWAVKLLIENPSVKVRRRATSVLAILTDTTDRFEWQRYSGFLERMLSDPDPQVSAGARRMLEKGLARSPALFDDARERDLRRRLGDE